MRALVLILLASCVSAPRYETPRYEPFRSPVDGAWHPAPPHCDGIPLVNRNGVVTGCVGNWVPPVYECAAEDSSGRMVRIPYATPAAPVPCSLLTTRAPDSACGSPVLVPDEFLHRVDNMPIVGWPPSSNLGNAAP
jgi:hypothetical protein